MLWTNNYFRFSITFLLCLQYSLLRETTYSSLVKPLPIIFWFFIVLFSPKRSESNWLLMSLAFAAIGDILLDLGADWLKIGIIPFLGSTVLLAIAFHFRLRAASNKISFKSAFLLLLPIAFAAIVLQLYLSPYLGDKSNIGAILLTLAVLLVWQSLAVLYLKKAADDPIFLRWIGLIGVCGIAANYILYAINISIQPIPRDLVIQVYYWGQAFVSWSFLVNQTLKPLPLVAPAFRSK